MKNVSSRLSPNIIKEMENLIFFDHKIMPLVICHEEDDEGDHDDDYNDWNITNTKAGQTKFVKPCSTYKQAQSASQFRQT